MELTSVLISSAAGIVLSALFSYVPGLRTWYGAQDSGIKSLIMLGSLVLVSGFIAASSCLDWWVFITCDKGGIMKLLEVLAVAFVSNQSTYLVTKNSLPEDVEVAKINRR